MILLTPSQTPVSHWLLFDALVFAALVAAIVAAVATVAAVAILAPDGL